jgi:hypothetical protein
MKTALPEEQGLYCPTFDGDPTDDDLRPDIIEEYSPAQLPFDVDQQRRILSVILRDEEVGKLAAERLNPSSFVDQSHQAIASFTFKFLHEYGGLPTPDIVMGHMRQSFSGHKNCTSLLQRVRDVLDYTNPNTCERQFYFDEIARFAKADIFRRTFNEGLEAIKQGRYDFTPIITGLQEAQEISSENSSTLEALDAIQFFDMAEQDERSWLLGQWICEGSLHLFAGQKKIGKSTLLHSMIAALMTGQDWFGEIGCQQAPVVYLDFENPADYVKSNLLQMMPRQDYEPVREWLRMPKSLPTALTGDWLLRFLDHNNLTAYSSGVIFIDSARRAFNGLFPEVSNWENNASEVSRCMQPMLKIARDTNFAVVIIHHDNKSNDSAGSVDWEAVSDFVWHYTASGTDRILSSKHGRYVGREPESMVFRKPEDRLQLAGLAGDIRAHQSEKKRQSKLDELVCDVVPHIPELDLGAEATETNTVTVRDLIEKTGKSRDVLQKELRSLRIEGVVQSGQMKPGKNKPLHYWRNNQALS